VVAWSVDQHLYIEYEVRRQQVFLTVIVTGRRDADFGCMTLGG
jgi:hypothetical protein